MEILYVEVDMYGLS